MAKKAEGSEKPKKSVLKKAADAVEKLIHPDHAEAAAEGSEAVVESPVRQNQMQSDLAKHPKFAKFKSQGENQP